MFLALVFDPPTPLKSSLSLPLPLSLFISLFLFSVPALHANILPTKPTFHTFIPTQGYGHG